LICSAIAVPLGFSHKRRQFALRHWIFSYRCGKTLKFSHRRETASPRQIDRTNSLKN
jgi:hypothetical protein